MIEVGGITARLTAYGVRKTKTRGQRGGKNRNGETEMRGRASSEDRGLMTEDSVNRKRLEYYSISWSFMMSIMSLNWLSNE